MVPIMWKFPTEPWFLRGWKGFLILTTPLLSQDHQFTNSSQKINGAPYIEYAKSTALSSISPEISTKIQGVLIQFPTGWTPWPGDLEDHRHRVPDACEPRGSEDDCLRPAKAWGIWGFRHRGTPTIDDFHGIFMIVLPLKWMIFLGVPLWLRKPPFFRRVCCGKSKGGGCRITVRSHGFAMAHEVRFATGNTGKWSSFDRSCDWNTKSKNDSKCLDCVFPIIYP